MYFRHAHAAAKMILFLVMVRKCIGSNINLEETPMFSTIGYWICIPFAALLRLFYTTTGSYGIALILFTLVIKLVLLPFQMKSKRSMVRMNRMNGRIQEIQKKYANNQAKMQEELTKFYAEEGYNPMSGCLWSFLPLPIMIALYSIIRRPIVYFMDLGGKAAATEVLNSAREMITNAGVTLGTNTAYQEIEIAKVISRQFPEFAAQHEGWININYNFLGVDLTTTPTHVINMVKDGGFSIAAIILVLIPILCGGLGFLQSKVSMMGQSQEGATATTNKAMMFMMPLMSIYIGFIMPAALGVYWVSQSVFSIIQEWILGKFYNKKIEEEETAREEARQADRKRRMEEAKEKEKERQQQEKKKQTLREKQQAAQEAKAAKAAKAATATTEAGRVGDRPYARGRAYKADRYDEQ